MNILASAFPVGDWQFWVVTLAALIAAYFVLKAVVPDSWKPRRLRKAGKRANLTIGGKAAGKK